MKVSESLKFDNSSLHYAIEEPSECPLCHFSIKPNKITLHPFWHDKKKYAAGLYLCNHCFQVFCTLSMCNDLDIFLNGNHLYSSELIYVGPSRFSEHTFDPLIQQLSPLFVKIYNQALAAECSNLDEIAGIGYRKSLEFLVKDFCIHFHPELEEKIKVKPLQQCIKEYIDNPHIKTLAEKSAWIGNDETHYTRKQEDRDITDMKRFINAMVYFICMVLIAEDADTITPA